MITYLTINDGVTDMMNVKLEGKHTNEKYSNIPCIARNPFFVYLVEEMCLIINAYPFF